MCAKQIRKYKLEYIVHKWLKKVSKIVSIFIQTPWQAVYIYASSHLKQQTRIQMYLNTT